MTATAQIAAPKSSPPRPIYHVRRDLDNWWRWTLAVGSQTLAACGEQRYRTWKEATAACWADDRERNGIQSRIRVDVARF